MWTFADLIKHFFTHKDFLPGADQLPGTLFTPLHVLLALMWALAVAAAVFFVSKKSERGIRRVFAVLWVFVLVLEVSKILWETYCGKSVRFEWGGILPLYPCSIFMYAMPFAIWGKGCVRRAACGYVCSLGLLGGLINFVYPANILSNYSCVSFAGAHTFFYHGSIVFCALTMLISGYHSYTWVQRPRQLLVPAGPFLIVSVIANAVNFSSIDSDYMFFKLESFIFAPLGRATADWVAVILVYAAYLLIHALPYLPHFLLIRTKTKAR
ncbi:MAG: YwaF family protein [Clostridia bacterium]|nr:YwaF family protein [Clostridia bacterium]